MQGSVWCGSLKTVLQQLCRETPPPSSAYFMPFFLSPKVNMLRLINKPKYLKYLEFFNFIYWIFCYKFRMSAITVFITNLYHSNRHPFILRYNGSGLFKNLVLLWVASGVALQSNLYMARFWMWQMKLKYGTKVWNCPLRVLHCLLSTNSWFRLFPPSMVPPRTALHQPLWSSASCFQLLESMPYTYM